MLDTAAEVLGALVQGIIDAIPDLITSATEVVTGFVDYLGDNADAIVDAGVQLMESLVTGIANNLPALITSAAGLVDALRGLDVHIHAVERVEVIGRVVVPAQMQDGDRLEIYRSTTDRLACTLTREGKTSNIFSKLDEDSTLTELQPGDNVLSMQADSGAAYLQASVSFYPMEAGILPEPL